MDQTADGSQFAPGRGPGARERPGVSRTSRSGRSPVPHGSAMPGSVRRISRLGENLLALLADGTECGAVLALASSRLMSVSVVRRRSASRVRVQGRGCDPAGPTWRRAGCVSQGLGHGAVTPRPPRRSPPRRRAARETGLASRAAAGEAAMQKCQGPLAMPTSMGPTRKSSSRTAWAAAAKERSSARSMALQETSGHSCWAVLASPARPPSSGLSDRVESFESKQEGRPAEKRSAVPLLLAGPAVRKPGPHAAPLARHEATVCRLDSPVVQAAQGRPEWRDISRWGQGFHQGSRTGR